MYWPTLHSDDDEEEEEEVEEGGDDGNDCEGDDDGSDGDDADWEEEDGYLKDFNMMHMSPFRYGSLVFFDDNDVTPTRKN